MYGFGCLLSAFGVPGMSWCSGSFVHFRCYGRCELPLSRGNVVVVRMNSSFLLVVVCVGQHRLFRFLEFVGGKCSGNGDWSDSISHGWRWYSWCLALLLFSWSFICFFSLLFCLQEPEPIDWEYYRKGIGPRLVDMYKEAYDSKLPWLLLNWSMHLFSRMRCIFIGWTDEKRCSAHYFWFDYLIVCL